MINLFNVNIIKYFLDFEIFQTLLQIMSYMVSIHLFYSTRQVSYLEYSLILIFYTKWKMLYMS